MSNIILDPELVEIGLDCPDKESVLAVLSASLRQKDYVTEDYLEQLLAREKEYPTGLPTRIPVALCHTYAQYVKKSALAVATLKTPVSFQEMGTPENEVKAEIVFLLALNDPKDQVSWLKKMVTIFKDPNALDTIQQAADSQELVSFLETCL